MGLLLGKAIYSILSGNTSLHSILSGATSDKIYPIFAPDEILNPFIVYQRKSTDITYTKDGLTYDDCIITINVVSDNYTEGIEISSYVRQALERIEGTYNGVQIYQSLLSSINEDYGVDGFITTLEFAIKAK